MTFFNKKEEVLDIQLTQFGKHLLSMGKLKPAYYAFFDDDILYDSKYGGHSELRNDVGDRIRNETPSTKVQYVYSGIETNFEKAKQIITKTRGALYRQLETTVENQQLQTTTEKFYALGQPLGHSSLLSEYAPSWKVDFLQGEISGTTEYRLDSHGAIRIPQINVDTVTYYTFPHTPELGDDMQMPENDQGKMGSDLDFVTTRFEDGSYIKIEEDYIFIAIDEQNSPMLKENFDIEVFLEETDPKTGQEVLTPLFFEKKCKLVDENNILLDQKPPEPNDISALDRSHVSYFFDVYVDGEIDKKVLCKTGLPKELEYSYMDLLVDCEESEGMDSNMMYETEIKSEDLEDLDKEC